MLIEVQTFLTEKLATFRGRHFVIQSRAAMVAQEVQTAVAEVRAQDEDAPRARTLLSGGDDDGVCGGRDGGPEYL